MEGSLLNQAKTVDLAQDLQQLGGWGFNNVATHAMWYLAPGMGCLTGLLLTIANPFWLVSSAIFGALGTEKLKKGDITGAERTLARGRLTNWLLMVPCLVAWLLFFHSCKPGGRVYRRLHKPKVEVVQSASTSTAAKPTAPSIRTKMRRTLAGGHVLQVWNAAGKPVACVATLENPELRSSPTYRFALEPGTKKPQELGLKQFGHRIKKKPRCSVVIEVPETGETYRYTP